MAETRSNRSDNRVRNAWARGGPAILGWMQIPSALAAETLAQCGYDGLVIDLQHSPIDFATTVWMLAAIEARGCEPLVRVAANDAAQIGKLLDAGAYGVISPMIETEAQAAMLADAVRYPPAGRRSYGPRRPVFRYGADYPAFADQTIVAFAMIETRLGLDNLEAILAVEGIDGVFVGPADLALALGALPLADSAEEEVMAAIRYIRERAHAHGKRAGIFCAGVEFARAKLAEGFDMVSLAPDLLMLRSAAQDSVARVVEV